MRRHDMTSEEFVVTHFHDNGSYDSDKQSIEYPPFDGRAPSVHSKLESLHKLYRRMHPREVPIEEASI